MRFVNRRTTAVTAVLLLALTGVIAPAQAQGSSGSPAPVAAADPSPDPAILGPDGLKPGDYLINNGYRAIMQTDGNLVVYAPDGFVLWNSGTVGNPGARAESSGTHLQVIAPSGRVLWQSPYGGRIELKSEGSFGSWAYFTKPNWTTPGDSLLPPYTLSSSPDTLSAESGVGTLPYGNALTSRNGRYRLAMQDDGNLVLYAGSRVLWATYSLPISKGFLTLQSDGNVVVYERLPKRARWQSGTSESRTGRQGTTLAVQDDGNVVLYDDQNQPLWWTGTAGR